MRCDKGRGTLIRYAGSASEASTDSQPMGSELLEAMVIVWLGSQGTPNRSHVSSGHRAAFGARS